MPNYSRFHLILDATPGTDWNVLRARYKRLIGQWHPDRFSGDAVEREFAEERSKQITIAYRELEQYYRDHGALPPLDPPATSQRAQATARDVAAHPSSAPSGRSAETDTSEPATRGPRRQRHMVLVLSAICATWYAAYRYSDDAPEVDETAGAAGVREIASSGPSVVESRPDLIGISAGSTLGEVYAIQGIPTLTEGDTWHYGKSSIRFAQGKVVSWSQHPDNPLRIARDHPIQKRNDSFDVGSTKDEVRLIQGTPVTETETVWDYGPSRVYFLNNRVVAWEANPLQPLRVRR